MKKLILIISMLVVSFGFSQKRLTILNYSSLDQKVYRIQTKATGGAPYPFCYHNGSAVGLVPGASCLLENLGSATKFPFNSTIPANYINPINRWYRQVNAATLQNLTNNIIWNLTTSSAQEFNFATIVGGNLSATNTFIIYGTAGNGGFRADYERVIYSTNKYEDFIIFTDL